MWYVELRMFSDGETAANQVKPVTGFSFIDTQELHTVLKGKGLQTRMIFLRLYTL